MSMTPVQGEVLIKGEATEGETILVSTSGVSDEDGIASMSVGWEASTDGRNWRAIETGGFNATGPKSAACEQADPCSCGGGRQFRRGNGDFQPGDQHGQECQQQACRHDFRSPRWRIDLQRGHITAPFVEKGLKGPLSVA